MRARAIVQIVGLLLMLCSMAFVPPIVVSLWYHDGQVMHFFYSLVLVLAPGFLIRAIPRSKPAPLRVGDGFLVVALFWSVFGVLSAVPFVFSPHLDFYNAVFEAVSGITTTGATVITGLDTLPKSVLFYRQELQWLGGMGIVVLAVAILPMLGVGGMQLYQAETPGPVKGDKLTPRIKNTARALWTIYVGLTLACAFAYRLAGMSWFDAVAHSLTTVSTGGFSTHDASLGYFDSPLIELIAVGFMMAGAINFAAHYLAVGGQPLRAYLGNEEVRAFFVATLIVTLVAGTLVWTAGIYTGFGATLRYTVFHVVSVITSTGYATTGFADWPAFLPVLLILLSFIGGCAGSTAGGMKVVRWLLIFRQSLYEVAMLIHPHARIAIKINGRPISARVVLSIWGFFSAYILTFVFLMLMMMWTGVDQITAFSAIATCMNNLGPGLGQVATSFSQISHSGLVIAVLAMLLGRLEIFTFFVLVSPSFWKR